MSNDLDEMLSQGPTLTFEPFPSLRPLKCLRRPRPRKRYQRRC